MLPADSRQEVCLIECKAVPDSEEKYQKLKELAKSFNDKKIVAIDTDDSQNEHICEYYLQMTQEAIDALSPEYEQAERARMIEPNARREELRAFREKGERRPRRPDSSALFDSHQYFARHGILSPERKEESPPRSAMALSDGWQERYLNYYKAIPDSKEKYQKLKELAETLEEQMRIALGNQNLVNFSSVNITYI